MNEPEDNGERDFNDLRSVISDGLASRPTEDVVCREGLTRETLLALDRLAARSRADMVIPPEIVTDDNGIPVSVGESQTTSGSVAGVIVTHRQLQRVGLTPQDVPHLTIVGRQPR